MKADAVFEGGGVKGVALIGALEEMERHGYEWDQVAGTSAGAIVAALVSAGYRGRELYPIFRQLDYLSFLRHRGLGRLPVVGPLYALLRNKGLYPSDSIERFLDDLLAKKGIRAFGDLPPGRLRVIASDITGGRMLVLPDDLADFGVDPQRFPVARAVRMSCGIPYIFQPFVLVKQGVSHYIVDGGLLSNFPVWLFDVEGIPRWPTFGFRLSGEAGESRPEKTDGLFDFTKALLVTMVDAHDRLYVKKAHAVRTVFIPTLGVRTTQFNLPESLRQALYESGREAAREFLRSWDFERYIRQFRQPCGPPPAGTNTQKRAIARR